MTSHTPHNEEIAGWEYRLDSIFLFSSKASGDPAIEYVNQANIIQDTKPLKDFIRQERQRLLDEVLEIVGEDDLVRKKEDMLENQYHRAKGRNQLRAELRNQLLNIK